LVRKNHGPCSGPSRYDLTVWADSFFSEPQVTQNAARLLARVSLSKQRIEDRRRQNQLAPSSTLIPLSSIPLSLSWAMKSAALAGGGTVLLAAVRVSTSAANQFRLISPRVGAWARKKSSTPASLVINRDVALAAFDQART